MEPADLPLVLTVEEAAKELRISRGSAYEGIRTGEIPHVRIGRTIRVPRHLLFELLGLATEDDHPENGHALSEAQEATQHSQADERGENSERVRGGSNA